MLVHTFCMLLKFRRYFVYFSFQFNGNEENWCSLMLKQCARQTFLGLKAKILSWRTWQKRRWRAMLTSSLFNLLSIISEKSMLRCKTNARYVANFYSFHRAASQMMVKMKSVFVFWSWRCGCSPQLTCFPLGSHWIPSLFGHTISASFSQSCGNLSKCSTFYLMHRVICVNLHVYMSACMYFPNNADVFLVRTALSGQQCSFMTVVLIMQAEVICHCIQNWINKMVLIYG